MSGSVSPVPPSLWAYGYLPTLSDWQAAFASGTGAAIAAEAQATAATTLAATAETAAAAALNAATAPATVVSTGSTTSRLLSARFAEIVSVRDFGAVGDGVTDDTVAIQAAIATGRQVYFPPATYHVTGSINLATSGQHIWGDGNSSIISTGSATADVFVLGGTLGTVIEHLQFTASVVRTAGAYVNTGAASFCTLEHLFMTGFFIGIQLGSSTTIGSMVRVTDCYLYGGAAPGVSTGLYIWGGDDVILKGVLCVGSAASQLATGIMILSAGDIFLIHCQCIWAGNGVVVAPGSGQVVQSLWFDACLSDTCSGWGMLIEASGSGSVQLLKCSNGWNASCVMGGIGLFTSGTGVIQQVDVVNMVVSNHSGSGIFAGTNGVTHLNIAGCAISANQGGGGAIALAAAMTLFRIASCTIGPCGEFGGNAGPGIALGSGADYFHVVDNVLLGNTGGGLVLPSPAAGAGTNWIIRGNLGFATYASGTLSTTAGPASFTVTHNLPFTPDVHDVVLTLIGALGAASFFYLGTPTGSSFTIVFNTAPGAGINVAWCVRALGT